MTDDTVLPLDDFESRSPGAHPADEGRYGAFDLDENRTVIYDVRIEEAWLESNCTIDIDEMV